jgi:hypothetical protein
LEGAISPELYGGLVEDRHPGQKPSVRTPKLQARILAAINNGRNDGSTDWSCRKLASRFGVSRDTVQRILTQADMRPHGLERYMASDDPDLENKATHVMGLYTAQRAGCGCVLRRRENRSSGAGSFGFGASSGVRADWRATVSNTAGTALCRCMPHWM